MGLFRNLLLVAILCCGASNGVPETEDLKVSLYYESLCPDSVRFVTRQLYPTYQKVHEIFEIDFVPYGFGTTRMVKKQWYFTCQHGPHECFGNKIQACALQQNVTQTQHLEFINCVMGNPDPASERAAKTCCSKADISWEAVNDCLSSGEGDELLAEYGKRTVAVRPKIRYVPTIIFNDVFNQTVQNQAEHDFLGVACQFLRTRPSACTGIGDRGAGPYELAESEAYFHDH